MLRITFLTALELVGLDGSISSADAVVIQARSANVGFDASGRVAVRARAASSIASSSTTIAPASRAKRVNGTERCYPRGVPPPPWE